jgi:acetyltransferase-like isoleucine patch superfamily enzyme
MESVGRKLSWDWYPGVIPENVIADESAYIETTYSFHLYRSQAPVGVRIGRGASIYLATMFDVGANGRLSIGDYALINGARIICDSEIEIGDNVLISWNVVLMDTYRVPIDPVARRWELERAPFRSPRRLDSGVSARPIHIGRNVWIGFDACVQAGVTIGEGAVVGARSVVTEDVEPFSLVAGNPARPIRKLERGETSDGLRQTS